MNRLPDLPDDVTLADIDKRMAPPSAEERLAQKRERLAQLDMHCAQVLRELGDATLDRRTYATLEDLANTLLEDYGELRKLSDQLE